MIAKLILTVEASMSAQIDTINQKLAGLESLVAQLAAARASVPAPVATGADLTAISTRIDAVAAQASAALAVPVTPVA
jgi:hypothetical protein